MNNSTRPLFNELMDPWLEPLGIKPDRHGKWSCNSIKCIQHALIANCALSVIETDKTDKKALNDRIIKEFTAFMDDDEAFILPEGVTRERLWEVTTGTQYTGKKQWDAWVTTRAECTDYHALFCNLFPKGKLASGDQIDDALRKFRIALCVKDKEAKAKKKAKTASKEASAAAAAPAAAAAAAAAAEAPENASPSRFEKNKLVRMKQDIGTAAGSMLNKGELAVITDVSGEGELMLLTLTKGTLNPVTKQWGGPFVTYGGIHVHQVLMAAEKEQAPWAQAPAADPAAAEDEEAEEDAAPVSDGTPPREV